MAETRSSEMPFGVALFLLFVGVGLLLGSVLGWLGPALWVHFAYVPATATVLEAQPAEWPTSKGGPIYGLRAQLAFTAGGREYRPWVRLPGTTRRRDGAEAEAVRTQVSAGQQVACFHDPYHPGTGVVLERTKLEWAMILGVLFPLAFIGGGACGLAVSWPRTFPRGVAAAASEVARRLPGSFYLYLLDASAFAAGGVVWLAAAPRGLGLVGLLGALAGAVLMIRRAMLAGAVAWPSPERRAARGRGAGHPAAGEKPARPTPARWQPPAPVAVGRGERLAIRLERSDQGDYQLAAVLFSTLTAGSFLLVILEHARHGLMGRPRWMVAEIVIAACLLCAAAATAAFWVWYARRTRGLAVEVSGHPLRAARRYDVALLHRNPAVLPGLSLTLVRLEEASTKAGRRGQQSSRRASTQVVVALADPGPGRSAGVRRGRLAVPDGAVPSLALEHRWVDWSLAVRLARWIPCTVRFPVTVVGPRATTDRVARKPEKVAFEDGDPAVLWLDGGPEFSPGSTLSGGYAIAPADGRPLESIELSVLWETDNGWPREWAVCHYEDRAAVEGDERTLHGTAAFRARLPDGPPSYEGPIVKIRWRVRLRLRHADGGESLHERPFSLGRAEA